MRTFDTTWDGLSIAPEKPYACCVVVWREGSTREFLVLHRLAPGGADFEGEWAWTPPSGARQPGELPDAAAARELWEETGLTLPLASLRDSVTEDVALYVAQAPVDAKVVLDFEHDRFLWLPIEEALPKCMPPVVGAMLSTAADWIDPPEIDGD